jgi:hypothetical protein
MVTGQPIFSQAVFDDRGEPPLKAWQRNLLFGFDFAGKKR